MKKIAQATIDEIRNHVKDNPSSSYKQVAASFGVSEVTVKRICADLGRGKDWRRGQKQTPSAHDKFWSTVDRTGNGCWEWQGSLNNSGYGFVHFNGKSQAAHRVAYCLVKGSIAEGLDLDHRCRNRVCCNPAHLEAVTREENMRRMRSANSLDGSSQHPSVDADELPSKADVLSSAGERPRFEDDGRPSFVRSNATGGYLGDLLEDQRRKWLDYLAKTEAEDRRWGLTADQVGVTETRRDRIRTFTISSVPDGIGVCLPARSARFAKEMFDSVWGHGYDVQVQDNEGEFSRDEAASFSRSAWRDLLQQKYRLWESSDDGRRCLARMSAERTKKLLAEKEEREIDYEYQMQWTLQLAELKAKSKAKCSNRSRSVCRTCGARRREYDESDRRESYPDEVYLEEMESVE